MPSSAGGGLRKSRYDPYAAGIITKMTRTIAASIRLMRPGDAAPIVNYGHLGSILGLTADGNDASDARARASRLTSSQPPTALSQTM